jgi:hypothetical protein
VTNPKVAKVMVRVRFAKIKIRVRVRVRVRVVLVTYHVLFSRVLSLLL